jgi:hypothetical protein
MSRTPVSFRYRPKDGSIKAGTEILISLTWPAGSVFRKKEHNPSTPIMEKSKTALLPVRWAIRITDGVISSGRQTKPMMETRCSATLSGPFLQGDTSNFKTITVF